MFVRESYHTDPAVLAPRLRDADLMEVEALADFDGLEALEHSRKDSACWTLVTDDGLPVGMFGVTPQLGAYEETGMHVGIIWYLGSDEATARPKEFMELSREWLDKISEKFDILGNYVDARNAKHIKWIKAMGFQFVDVHPYHGVAQIPFLEFMLIPEAANV